MRTLLTLLTAFILFSNAGYTPAHAGDISKEPVEVEKVETECGEDDGIDITTEEEFKAARPQCTNQSESEPQGGTLTSTLCSNTDPAATITGNPNGYATARCDNRCKKGRCMGLSVCTDTLSAAPTVVAATCTQRGNCRSGKKRWDCDVTLTTGAYDCDCRCR